MSIDDLSDAERQAWSTLRNGALRGEPESPALPRVRRGAMVYTFGPWANGHDEQCAIVTHVTGDGDVPGVLVNLHVFVDEGASMLATLVPWYPTREAAKAALEVTRDYVLPEAGPRVCFFD